MTLRWIARGLLFAGLLVPSACVQLLLGDHEYQAEETSAASSAEQGSSVSSGAGSLFCETGLTACDGACTPLDSDPHNCGTCGHDCLDADCHAGVCSAVEIASGLSDPRDLAVDESFVYWTTATGTLQRVALAGGTVTNLADGQDSPGPLAVDDKYVFWTNEGTGRLMRLEKDGPGKVKQLFKGDALASIALDGERVYMLRKIKKGDVRRVGKGGEFPVTLAFDQPDPSDIRVLDEHLLWAGEVISDDDTGGMDKMGGYVRAMPRGGGEVVTLATGEGNIVALAAGGGMAIWADSVSRRIRAHAVPGGETVTLADGQNVRDVAASDTDIAWTTAGGTVRSMPLEGGAVRLLAADISNAGAIAMDGQYVYFLRTGQDGAVLRVAR